MHPNANIGEGVVVSPFASVDEDVVIGDGCWIGPHAHIMEGTRLGKNCKIFHGAIVGNIPQDLKFKGEKTELIVGDNTVIREYCTVNRGTSASGKTQIGSDCLLMAYVHVAHDCIIGNKCILANSVNVAGHVEIDDYAILGGMSAIHQFVKIGAHAILGGGSLVGRDVPPYVTAARNPLSYCGVNSRGLKRRGFDLAKINHLADIYRILFVHGNSLSKALYLIETQIPVSDERDAILQFVEESSTRGIIRGPRFSKTGNFD